VGNWNFKDGVANLPSILMSGDSGFMGYYDICVQTISGIKGMTKKVEYHPTAIRTSAKNDISHCPK